MDQTRRKILLTGLGAVAFTALSPNLGLAKKGFFWLSTLGSAPTLTASTKGPNGDSFPIGVTIIPEGFPTDGLLQPGDLLVSNNADLAGVANQGSTIMRITPAGETSTFFTGPAGMGLRRGLAALSNGFIIATSEPSLNGGMNAGSLLVIDRFGKTVAQLTDGLINGPNALVAREADGRSQIFLTNSLTGDLVRADLSFNNGTVMLASSKKLAGGLSEVTGLYLSGQGNLWVADSAHNAAAVLNNAIANAHAPQVVYSQKGIVEPRGLVIAPNGNLLVLNGQENSIIEFTKDGKYAGRFSLAGSKPGVFTNMSIISFEGAPTLALTQGNENELILLKST